LIGEGIRNHGLDNKFLSVDIDTVPVKTAFHQPERFRMESPDLFFPMLTAYATQVPVLIVWVVGLVLAGVRWSRHPRVSMLAVIALGLLLLNLVVNVFTGFWLPHRMMGSGMSAGQMQWTFAVRGIVGTVLVTVAWGLTLGAIFGWRNPKA
jgi:hypothetical protein